MAHQGKVSEEAFNWVAGLLDDPTVGYGSAFRTVDKETDRQHRVINRQVKKFKILCSNLEFDKDVAAIRDRCGIPQKGFSKQDGDTITKFARVIQHQKKSIQQRVRKLAKKYRCSGRWTSSIEHYVLFNSTDIGHIVPLPIEVDLRGSDQSLSIEIFRDTSLRDIQDMWSFLCLHKISLPRLGDPEKAMKRMFFADSLEKDKRIDFPKELSRVQKAYHLKYRDKLTYPEVIKRVKFSKLKSPDDMKKYVGRYRKYLEELTLY